MAQLSDDSFAFAGKLMPVDDATAILSSRVRPVEHVEIVDLGHADGRILAADISAPLPLPPFTNSAVDGYAVSSRDLSRDPTREFTVVGRIQAGAAAVEALTPGRAVRIFTGAPMPVGADTVFMQEDVRLDASGNVILPSGLKAGANVRPMGEDFAEGVTALPAGRRMRPQDVALAAALGLTQIEVRRRIRVAVFSTGDEIGSPGSFGRATQLFDSNRFMQSDGGAVRLRSERSPHFARRSRLIGRRPEAGNRLARPHPYDRRRVDWRRRPCQKRRSRLSDRLCYGAWPSSRDVQLRWASSRERRS